MPVDELSDCKRTPKAGRRKLSWASWIVGALIIGLWIPVTIPGLQTRVTARNWFREIDRQHGWPFTSCRTRQITTHLTWTGRAKIISPDPLLETWKATFLAEKTELEWAKSPDKEIDSDKFWSVPGNWQFFGNRQFFGDSVQSKIDWRGLAADLFVLLFVIAVAVALVEIRLRIRGSLFRFRLWEGLTAITVLGIVFGVIVWETKNSSREMQAGMELDRLCGFSSPDRYCLSVEWENGAPGFLRRVLDNRTEFELPFEMGTISWMRGRAFRLHKIPKAVNDSESEKRKLIACVANFDDADTMFACFDPSTEWMLQSGDFSRIENLMVSFGPGMGFAKTVEEWSWLQRFPSLKSVEVFYSSGFELGPEGVPAKAILRNIIHPGKLESLNFRKGVLVSRDTDFHEFTSLKNLELAELGQEEKESLIQNNSALESLLNSE